MNADSTSIHDVYWNTQPSGATITGVVQCAVASGVACSPNTNKWTNNEYSFVLTTPGAYGFVCEYHSWMKGSITVS